MLDLDGSDAGGQFLRTSLALAALTDTPVRVENVRGDRPDPGLAHQHRAVVDALARLCDADVTGAQLGAETVEFDPGGLRARDIEVDVGTAGSISLLFDAVVPLAVRVDAPLTVTATGGTEVAWSPPLAYLSRVKLPLLRRHGLVVAVDRHRTGFYPAGGGRATLTVAPSRPRTLELTDRGPGGCVDVVSIAAAELADSDVAARQATAVRERLAETDLSVRHVTTTDAETNSPGTAVLVALAYNRGRAGFSALGEPGKPAEDVGRAATEPAVDFHERARVAVDRHLADQLLVVLAIAGGRVAVPAVTDHVETSIELLASFGVRVAVEDDGDRTALAVTDPL